MNRDFTATGPNQRWVADFTLFPTGEGELHLAEVRDLFHHGIVSWDTREIQDTTLAVSFGSVGDAYDNAALESFLARLKVESAWIRDGSICFPTQAQVHAYLFEFIEATSITWAWRVARADGARVQRHPQAL